MTGAKARRGSNSPPDFPTWARKGLARPQPAGDGQARSPRKRGHLADDMALRHRENIERVETRVVAALDMAAGLEEQKLAAPFRPPMGRQVDHIGRQAL